MFFPFLLFFLGVLTGSIRGNQGSELRAAALPGQRPQPGDGGYRAVEHGVPGARHPGVGRGRQAGGRRAAAIPVAAGLGAHQPNRRLRLAAEPQTGRREVSAPTDARKTLAYDFFRILRAPLVGTSAGQGSTATDPAFAPQELRSRSGRGCCRYAQMFNI